MDVSSPEASPPSAGVLGAAPAAAKRKTLKRVLNRIRGRTLASAEPGSFLMAKDKVLAMEHELERTLNMMRSNQQLIKHMYTELSRNNTSSEEEFIALFNSQANHCLKHVELCQILVVDSITRKLALVQEIKRKCKDELDFAHLQLEDVKNKLASETSSSQVKLAKYRDKLSRYQTEYDALSNSIFAVLDQILEDAGPTGTALGFIREECIYFKILQTELFAALHGTTAQTVDFPTKMEEAGEHTEDIWEEFRLRCCSRCTPTGFKTLLVSQAIKLPLPSFKAASASPVQSKTVTKHVDSLPREASPDMPKFQLRRPSGLTSHYVVGGEPKVYAFSNKSREELKSRPPSVSQVPTPPPLPVDFVSSSFTLEHEPLVEEIMHQTEFDEISYEEPVVMEEEQVIQQQQQVQEQQFAGEEYLLQEEEMHFETDLLEEEELVELEEFEQMDELAVMEPVEEIALDTFHEAIDDTASFLLQQQQEHNELLRQQQQEQQQRLAEQQQRLAQQQRIKQQQDEQRRLQQEKLRQQKQQEQELQLKLQRQQQKHEEQQMEQQRVLEEQRRMEQEHQERLKQQQQQQQFQKQQLQLKQQHQPSGPIPLPSSLDAVAAIKPSSLLVPASPKQKALESPVSRVVAVYDFAGEQPGDLAFKTGEELHILKDAPDAGWYVAKSVKTGKQGLVPFEGFLKRLPALITPPLPPPAVPKVRPVDPPRFRAQYDFAKEQDGDLACKTGDIVTFVRNGPTPEWFVAKHTATGQQGLVPREFFVEAPAAMLRKSSSSLQQQQQPGALKRNFVVVQPFTAQQQGDLTVQRGEVVEFVKSVSEDWVIVRNVTRGEQGLVPLTFLKDDMDAV